MHAARRTCRVEDRWILSRLNHLAGEVNKLMEDFQFGEAEAEFMTSCGGSTATGISRWPRYALISGRTSPLPVLVQMLETSLRLLHPFMPFITEELWQSLVSRLPQDATRPDSLIIAPYPVSAGFIDDEAEREMSLVIEIVRSIRNARAESKIDPAKRIEAHVHAKNNSAMSRTARPSRRWPGCSRCTSWDREQNRGTMGPRFCTLAKWTSFCP